MEFIDEVSEVKILGMSAALSNFSFARPNHNPKVKYRFQELGLEMQEWFPESQRRLMWSLFYKYTEESIREAWRRIQRTDKHTVPYLIAIIKNLK